VTVSVQDPHGYLPATSDQGSSYVGPLGAPISVLPGHFPLLEGSSVESSPLLRTMRLSADYWSLPGWKSGAAP
jgi:hypothetical protein